MPHCPHCRTELPGSETLCQECFEKGYDQVAHPKPWWQRRVLWHRPILTRNIVFASLFLFVIASLRGRASFAYGTFDSRRTITTSDLIALVLALVFAFVESTRKDSS
jgi:hypothetical protein